MKLIQWIKSHKIISIATLLSTVFVITFIVLLTTSLINNEKDKQNRTFLDRDKTEIICRRSEKIGSTIIQYKTKNNPDIWKTTLFLYCTDNPVIDGLGNDYHQLQGEIAENFYKKYEKKMDIGFYEINRWGLNKYSLEWDKKYILNRDDFDGYFIN